MTELKDYHVPKAICPYCGYVSDGALEAQPETKPGPRDISLCIACSGVALFADNMTLRLPTRSEIIALRVSPVWTEIMKATFALRKARQSEPDGPKSPKHS